jgi:hypothetical protein
VETRCGNILEGDHGEGGLALVEEELVGLAVEASDCSKLRRG